MMLGLFFHGAISFVETPIGWAVRDRSTHVAVDVLVWVCHTFRMPLFFLLSGFFARLLVERDGMRGFVRHRVKRILVPLAVAYVPVGLALFALWQWGATMSAPHEATPWSNYPGQRLPGPEEMRWNPPPGHLWFLYYLLIFTVGVVLAQRIRMAGLAVSRGLPFVMAVPTAATLLLTRGLESETPVSFVPSLHICAYYGVFFGFGWLLHRQRERIAEFRRHLWLWLIAAAAVLPALFVFLEEMGRTGTLSPPWMRYVAVYLSALFSWLAIGAILGAATRWLDRPRPWVRWMADASYWCYIVHLPVTVFFQIVVARLEWPGPLKYALVMAGTLAVCLASYRYLVRTTFIGTALNGRRDAGHKDL